jgi:hypothetical protein
MMLAEALIVAGVLMAALLFLRRQRRRRPPVRTTRPARQDRPAEDYHCVELRPRGSACKAVRRYAGKRFLPDEAPRFPVPECDAARCSCRYARHADRRRGERRSPYGQWATLPPAAAGAERRSRTDRRKALAAEMRPTLRR